MSNRARELLERALDYVHKRSLDEEILRDEIRAYLAQPEVKREPLTLNAVVQAFNDSDACGIMDNFIAGALFAERHHGIGGEE